MLLPDRTSAGASPLRSPSARCHIHSRREEAASYNWLCSLRLLVIFEGRTLEMCVGAHTNCEGFADTRWTYTGP